jgi:hypothetical protein
MPKKAVKPEKAPGKGSAAEKAKKYWDSKKGKCAMRIEVQIWDQEKNTMIQGHGEDVMRDLEIPKDRMGHCLDAAWKVIVKNIG